MPRRHPAKAAALLAATTFCGPLALSGHALADTTDSQINAIEKQIRALQGQLDHMKRDLSARSAEVKAARSEAAQASRQAREAEERSGQTRFDNNGHPLAPPPLSAPPGYNNYAGYPGTQAPFANINGNPGYQPSGGGLKQGQFAIGAVRVTLGGFIEEAGIYRSRNEDADISSSFNTGIPFAQSPNYHQDEFRGSARQSRISLLAEASPNAATRLSAYYETDFNSAGVTSNSVESNSYTLRLRQLYATYARSDLDLYVLGGQAYSLATMNKFGIVPHQEDTPLQIDAQFVTGFVWKRDVGLRIVKGFDNDRFDIGVSVESPQSTYSIGGNGSGLPAADAVDTTNPGLSGNGGTLNSLATYSTEYAPDVLAKLTADPGWGHYELFGVARFLHDRVSSVGTGNNKTVLAGGVGGGVILPVIKGRLDFQASALLGQGIGTYGSGQFADATLARDGSPQPLPEVIALVGLIARPVKPVDLYAYVGTEQITHREDFGIGGKGYGYGSPLYSNAGCGIELSALPCTANTSGIVEGTLGGWWRFLKGDYGTMETGAQYAHVQRTAFGGIGGIGGSPKTDENILMFSYRYLPFQ